MAPEGSGERPAGTGIHNSLRLRILAIALAPALLGVIGVSAYFAQRSLNDAENALYEHGRDTAQNLASAIEYDYFVGDLPKVKHLLDYARTRHEILALGVSDRQGQWQVASGQLLLLPPPPEAGKAQESTYNGMLRFVQPIGIPKQSEEDPYLTHSMPVLLGGMLVILVDKGPLKELRRRTLLGAGGMLVLFLPLVGVVAWRMSAALSGRLLDLTGTVGRIAGGELDVRVREGARGELGVLERGINRMAISLEQSHSHLERRIREATAELEARRQAAEAAVQAKSRFLAAASHDLRQPLHALTLLVAALREHATRGETARLARHIEASAVAMESLLNSLLDLSRLDAGVVQAKPECFPVNTVLDRLEHQFSPIAADKKLTLRVHRTGMTTHTDPVLLGSILSNLVANAIRYTDRGKVLVGARREGRNGLRIEVWDSGRGIPVDYQARVFEEYFQLENPERDRSKGLGLGLAIVDRLSRLLATPVRMSSTPGRGSCFSVALPRCEAVSAPESTEIALPSAQSMLHGAMVVFIDDDQAILEAMTSLLDMWGMDLTAAADPEEAERELLAIGRSPDVILTDYRLRDGRTGLQAVDTLRRVFGEDLPAVLITGDTAPETIQALDRAGLPFMHKPLKPAKLRALLAHLLAGRAGGAAPSG